MDGIRRVLATVVGVLFIAFAVVVTAYAGEPFNIATLFGLAGGAILWNLYWKGPREA